MKLEYVLTKNAPPPAGHYAQAVKCGGFIFVSGQLPLVPGTEASKIGNIEDQARQALFNVRAVLEAAGSCIDKVVRVTVYISDIAQWNAVNDTYAEFFGAHTPARSIVPTKEMHFGYQFLVDVIAVV